MCKALLILKNTGTFEKESSKSEKDYELMVKTLLQDTMIDVKENLESQKHSIGILMELHNINDKFLIKKCNETIEKADKISKKIDKYIDNRKNKIKFREIYAIINLILEANKYNDLMKEYIHQLNRYK